MKHDDDVLRKHEKVLHEKYERICTGCGACCGATDGDPCACLQYDAIKKTYYCATYENRLGEQRTVSGKKFTCVLIRDLYKIDALPQGCAYRDQIK